MAGYQQSSSLDEVFLHDLSLDAFCDDDGIVTVSSVNGAPVK